MIFNVICEIWQPVQGFEERYIVSTQGRIFSIKREKYLNPTVPKHSCGAAGYSVVTLCKNGESKSAYVHRLVAEAFLPNPEGLRIVNHKDGNKQNNSIDNLEWCTQKENVAHAIKMGTHGKIRRKRERE